MPGTPAPSRSRNAAPRSTAFKQDPDCRVFLCTESGGVGLNLQNASVVINCDLPWNPAKLEQRIARAWRKGQTRPVQVINLIAEGTIEHGMLETLANKQGLADGVLDGIGELSEIKLKKGGRSFLSRLEQTLEVVKDPGKRKTAAHTQPAADPPIALAAGLQKSLGAQLLHCEEHFPNGAAPSKLYIVTQKLDPATKEEIRRQVAKNFGPQSSEADWLEDNVVHLDASSHHAMLQLQRAGLIQTSTRAKRQLLGPAPGGSEISDPRLPQYQSELAEELEAAAVLIAANLHRLAPTHLLNALLKTSQVRALKKAISPPQDLSELKEEPHLGNLPEHLQCFPSFELKADEEIEQFHAALGETQT